MAVELRHAREDEMEAVVDLLELVFRGGRKWFHNIITQDPWRDQRNTRLALVDGHVVANVQVHRRPVHYGVSRLTMGGIGHVATHPDFRGQGLSTALLNEAIGLMRQDGYHLSLLYTGINEFYARLGWTTIPFASTLGPLPKEAPQPSGLYAIENTTVPEGLPEAPGIYEQWAAGWVGALDRSPEYWRVNGSWTDDEFITEDHGATTRAMRDGRVCGYLRGRIANLPPSRCAIDEVCYLPGHEACVSDLVNAFIEAAREAGKECVEVDCGEGHPAEALVASATELSPEADTGAMFRIVDPAGLLNAAGAELAIRLRRLTGSLPPSLTLDCEIQRVRISLGTPVTAEAATGPTDGELTSEALLKLVLGRSDAGDLITDGSLSWIGADRTEILEALFPRRPYFYARFDRF